MTTTLHLDRFGIPAAAKEFLVSLVKTMVAAGLVYIVKRLGDYSATTPELVAAIGLARALITSALKYLTTTAIVEAPQLG